jgi:hypothetical protein
MVLHPAVAAATLTCDAVPVQWEGQLVDGRRFYFRYRFGRATLAVGPTKSVNGVTIPEQDRTAWVASVMHGDRFRGMFDSDEEQNTIFAELLEQIGNQPNS